MTKTKPVKRKTVKERVLLARAQGFYECLRLFEELFSERARAVIEAAQKQIRPVDDEWRALFFGRSPD